MEQLNNLIVYMISGIAGVINIEYLYKVRYNKNCYNSKNNIDQAIHQG